MCSEKASENSKQHTSIPDVAGYTLGEAKRLLAVAGVNIQAIKITTRPRDKDLISNYDENYRVIRIKNLDNNTAEMLICKPL